MGDRAQYKTRQYNLIMEYLVALGGAHTTISRMRAHFRRAGTPIGTATIYRHLEKLAEQGRVRKYALAGVAGACYQYEAGHRECSAHFHLKCEQCGRLIHLDCEETQSFQHHVRESHGFRANYSKTVIYGRCADCLGEVGRRGGQQMHGAEK